MTSTTLDELDSLLEEYLSLVDNYQSLQLSLESCLKSAYFNLAKSKIALGPHRLSQKGWDLKQKDSFVQVVIQQEESFQGLEETTTIWKEKEKEKEKENPSLLNYSIQPRPPSLSSTSSSTLPTSSTIRQRSQPSASAPASSSLSPNSPSSSEPNSKPPPPPPSLSPIHQFSSLPPPALRASAKSFESSLDKIVELVEVEARLRGLAKQIKGVKKRLRVEEKEGTREESTEEKCGGNKVGNRV